jgi:flavin reductase (DIM6/NTAB) family NADH-FMN oxidoreductase RutF
MTQSDEANIASDFRQALRGVASTVSIITARHGDRHHGMTVTSVMSVSMSPPALAVCINRATLLHGIMSAGTDFCINFLREEQSDLSALFSNRLLAAERFRSGGWLLETGQPGRLQDAQASILCAKSAQVEHGTHTLFIGDVVDVQACPTPEPLIYHNATYCRSQPWRAEASA